MIGGTARARAGFTLVELLLALALVGIIGMCMVRFFGAQQRAYARHGRVVLATENARAGLDLFLAEVRNAGFDPRRTAGSGLTIARRDTVAWSADLDADGDATGGGGGDAESVAYYFDPVGRALVRRTTGSTSPVIEGLDTLAFSYFDREGDASNDVRRIVRIDLYVRFTTRDGLEVGLLSGTHLPNRLGE